ILSYNTIAFAANEAARFASASGPNSPNPATAAQIQQIALNAATPAVNLAPSQVIVNWITDPNLATRKDVVVTISYPYIVSLPLGLSNINATLKLSSTSQMLASQ